MIHNIVTDNNGGEHQAVKSPDDIQEFDLCEICSADSFCSNGDIFPCTSNKRLDGVDAIYKRRIKIGDVKR